METPESLVLHLRRALENCRFDEADERARDLDRATDAATAEGLTPAEDPAFSLWRGSEAARSARVARAHAQGLVRPEPAGMPPLALSPPRPPTLVAYLVGEPADPLVARSLLALLAHHDRERFRILLLAPSIPGGDEGPGRPRFPLRPGDEFLDTRGRLREELSRTLRERGVEVLVDLQGPGPGEPLGPALVAGRSAPIQLHWLGFRGTTGGEAYDGFMAGEGWIADPQRAVFTEMVVASGVSAYGLLPDPRATARTSAPGRGPRTLATSLVGSRLDRTSVSVWAGLLERHPEAILRIEVPDTLRPEAIEAAFADRGIARSRLRILPLGDPSAGPAGADLVLEPMEIDSRDLVPSALAAGRPVLCLEGSRPSSTAAASTLRWLGLDELVATSAGAYLEAADRLLGNPDHLSRIADRIRELADRHPAFDPQAFTRSFEAALARARSERFDPRILPEWRSAIRKAASGKHAEAEAEFAALASRHPASPWPETERGILLQAMGRLGDAAASLDRSLALLPGSARALASRAWVARQGCEWDRLDELEARTREASDDALLSGAPPPELSIYALLLHLDPDRQLASARARARILSRRTVPLVGAPPPPRDPARERPVLAYLSDDFRNHATAHLAHALLGEHDRDRFRVHVYAYGAHDQSMYRHRSMAWADRFVDLGDADPGTIAARIREDRVDVLIDLKGWCIGHRLEVLAARPAPVQMTWLGFPGTVATPGVDYLVTDRIVTPPGDERFLAEAPIFLPDCYQVNDFDQEISVPPVSRRECGLPEEGLVFASMCQPYKIDPGLFSLWLEILAGCPGSVLWMYAPEAEVRPRLQARAEDAGIDPARLRFVSTLAKPEHLARLRHADLALDTLDCNGHTTASDLLWAGVPVVTTLGRAFASRVAASLLHSLGLEELVAQDRDGYRALALALARDPVRLRGVRRRLATARYRSPLFDTTRFARNLEEACLAAISRARSGLPPSPIELSAAPGASGPSPGLRARRARDRLPESEVRGVLLGLGARGTGLGLLSARLRSALEGIGPDGPLPEATWCDDRTAAVRFHSFGATREVVEHWRTRIRSMLASPFRWFLEPWPEAARSGLLETLAGMLAEAPEGAQGRPRIHVVTVERDPEATALHLLSRARPGSKADPWPEYMEPAWARNLLSPEPFRRWGRIGEVVWYVQEHRARAGYYRALLAGRPGIRIHSCRFEDLSTAAGSEPLVDAIRGAPAEAPLPELPAGRPDRPGSGTVSDSDRATLREVLRSMKGDAATLGRDHYLAGRRL